MDTGWIERVVQTNAAVVAAEARVNAKVAELLTRVMQGQDTAEGERLLVSYGHDLVRLRAIQAEQLRYAGAEG